MKIRTLLLFISTITFTDILLFQCANPQRPTGGPKDTIPPVLISSDPITGTTNFKENTLNLEFSEYINADKLSQNLIITPKTDIKYKHIVKRNTLSIKFEESFNDSTTYSLNFFDGVTDITEKTPAINLILAFSTGNYIDSLKISGQVSDLLSHNPEKKFIVGLYPITDTLDLLSETPTYFTTTNDSGRFELSYLKADNYKILAFEDENRNLLLDPETEKHAFVSDTLELRDSIPPIYLSSILQNVKPILLVNSRPIGSYHEIRFTRELDNYKFEPDTFPSNIVGDEKNVLRLYNPSKNHLNDSIPIIVMASDSLGNTDIDTLKIVFLESNRKRIDFNQSIEFVSNQLSDVSRYYAKFNKPVIKTFKEKIKYKSDTIFEYLTDSINITFNKNRTEAKIETYIIYDTLINRYERLFLVDSANFDSTTIIPKRSPISILFDKGTFLSVDGDTSRIENIAIKEKKVKGTGTLKLELETQETSFILQLLLKDKVKYQIKNELNPTFNPEAGNYSIRVLIDNNNDGKWSFGNLLKNIEPESVYIFPEEISVRENWVVEDIYISF